MGVAVGVAGGLFFVGFGWGVVVVWGGWWGWWGCAVAGCFGLACVFAFSVCVVGFGRVRG